MKSTGVVVMSPLDNGSIKCGYCDQQCSSKSNLKRHWCNGNGKSTCVQLVKQMQAASISSNKVLLKKVIPQGRKQCATTVPNDLDTEVDPDASKPPETRFQVMQNGSEWIPNGNIPCSELDKHNTPCRYTLGRFRHRKVFTMTGVKDLGVRHYKCKNHRTSKEAFIQVSVFENRMLNAIVTEPGVTFTLPVLITGDVIFSLDLAMHLFLLCMDSGWDLAQLRRAIGELWFSTNASRNLQGKGTMVMDDITASLPSADVLMRLMVAMHSWLPKYQEFVDLDEEGKVWRIDGTYASAKTCGIYLDGKYRKLPYCVVTLMGVSQVLNAKPQPSENATDLFNLVEPTLSKLKQAPLFCFVDDWKKWHYVH